MSNVSHLKLAIVLDATISYVPPSANPYHYLFSFGDTDAQGLPQRQVLSSTRPMSTSHVYSKPGTYHVNLTISDTPFIIGTSISGAVTYGITSGGYPAPVFGLVITVLDTQGGSSTFKRNASSC